MSAVSAALGAKSSIAAVLVVCVISLWHSEAYSLNGNNGRLFLRVDPARPARAFYAGMPVAQSIAGFFEFYERAWSGNRKRIISGPWGKSLSENATRGHTLSGADQASGVEYAIVFRQPSPNDIEISMNFITPIPSPSNLRFDIVKLSSDLFKGATIDASPASTDNVGAIPLEPLALSKRIILTGKNRVLLKGDLCDLEISDVTGGKTIVLADFRNVPWDKTRSIYLGGNINSLSPGNRLSLKYLIRCSPPSRSTALQNVKVYGSPDNPISTWSLLSPPPKEEKRGAGYYRVGPGDVIYGLRSGTAESVLAREILRRTALTLDIRSVEKSKPSRGIIIERAPPGNASGLPPEGFQISISPNKIVVKGADERGCLYGVYAVLDRLTRSSDKWQVSCTTLKDWPDLPIRGICMELLPPAIRDVNIVKRYLAAISRARGNTVIFLHNPTQISAWLKNVNDGGWAEDQMAELARYARSLQMDVWAGMGSGFTPRDFPGLDIRSGTTFYNPFNEASYGYLFCLYDKILQTYQPSTFLICHDEIKGLSLYAAESGRSTADILASDVNKINDWLRQRKVRTAMWGDMLLDFNKWDSEVGFANSLNSSFNSGATHLALQQISKEVLILDWHYQEKERYGSVDYFHRNGFDVVGSSWHDPIAAKSLTRSVKQSGGQGIIATDWGFLRTLSPAATTLYAPICGWSTNCEVDKTNSDVASLAGAMRDDVYGGNGFHEITVSLTAGNRSTIAKCDAGGGGLFGSGPVLDLRGLSSGKQNLGGITFDIMPGDDGRRQNCVVVTSADPKKDRLVTGATVFKGEMSAQAVALLHTAFIEDPQVRLRKVGYYLVDYDNGHSETVDLLENWNITDIRSSEGLRYNDWTFLRSPDVLIGAKRAWKGVSASQIPLNLQVFIWKNPHPEQKIRTIRLSTTKAPPNSTIALLGLTFLR